MNYAYTKKKEKVSIEDASPEERYYCPLCGSVVLPRVNCVKEPVFQHVINLSCFLSQHPVYDLSSKTFTCQKCGLQKVESLFSVIDPVSSVHLCSACAKKSAIL